tara:strand:- start:559 stop:1023 length:465 start_codon:yes stop_codon:yes gene_type:complete
MNMARKKKVTPRKKHGRYEYCDFKLNIRHADKKHLLHTYLGLLVANYEAEGQRVLVTASAGLLEGPSHAAEVMRAFDEYLLYLEEYREGISQLRDLAEEQLAIVEQVVQVKARINQPIKASDFAKQVNDASRDNVERQKKAKEKLAKKAKKGKE